MTKDIEIEIISTVDGDENRFQTTGEYKFDIAQQQHLVAYTDYAGNAITKNGLFIGVDKMMIHRVGAITSDMLFDVENQTFAQYQALMIKTAFLIDTLEYMIENTEEKIEVWLKYTLTDTSESRPIEGTQRIILRF